MSMTDPIADMLTRIRNGVSAKHDNVAMPSSKIKVAIAKVLKEEGFIANYKVSEEEGKRTLRVHLKYTSANEPVISNIERIQLRMSRFSTVPNTKPALRQTRHGRSRLASIQKIRGTSPMRFGTTRPRVK